MSAVATPGAPAFHVLTVAEVRKETPDSVVVTFDVPPDLRDAYSFLPGQHVTVRRTTGEGEVRRSYSVCAPAGGPLRVAARRIPDGAVSTWLNEEVRAGDRLDVMTPSGRFALPPSVEPAVYAAIAAGSGITPVLSIVQTLLRDHPETRVALLYVNRTVASTMFVEELEELRDRYLGRFRLAYVLTAEPGAVDVLTGRPDSARVRRLVEAGLFPADAAAYYVCGPEGLVACARRVLGDLGVDLDVVHSELFTATAAPNARDPGPAAGEVAATATAVLHGRGTPFPVAHGETLLAAGLKARPDLPYSCASGVCATCRARVVTGAVDMDVCYGLEPAEVADGFVLTCQARPTTPEVVVDYDA